MHSIHTFEQWQVIGFNRDSTQHQICAAHSLTALLGEFTKYLHRASIVPIHAEVLASFKAVKVWNVEQGFIGLDLPSLA